MEKSLIKNIKYSAGRSHGKISVRHKGGRVKRNYRMVDFVCNRFDIPAVIKSIEYVNKKRELAKQKRELLATLESEVNEKTAEKIDKEANNNKTMKGYSKICHELLNRIKSWKEIL